MKLLINANALSLPIAGQSAQCVVTSPPYWALRDYGVAGQLGLEKSPDCLGWATGRPCGECYVCHMVQAFREVWRVLRDDGVLFLNMGDTYTNGGKNGGQSSGKNYTSAIGGYQTVRNMDKSMGGLKPKDMAGIPWRVAFALQADGWYLRSDIIWAKPNAMPESVKDRPTKSHEYIFLLAKSERYFWDAEAVKESAVQDERRPTFRGGSYVGGNAFDNSGEAGRSTVVGNIRSKKTYSFSRTVNEADRPAGPNQHREDREDVQYYGTRNLRDVWTIATQPTKEAHFATFPEALAERCIKAGSRPGDIILDPFAGSGTTGRVAIKLNRRFVGTELNLNYLSEIAANRTNKLQPCLVEATQ